MEKSKDYRDVRIISVGEIGFDKGRFDKYAVRTDFNGWALWPSDTEMFEKIRTHYNKNSVELFYSNFLIIYNAVSKDIKLETLDLIHKISLFCPDQKEAEALYCYLYYAMVAEENKENAVLKKRIKRLGVYQFLFEGFSKNEAANFSKGKSVSELDLECSNRGF